MPLSPRTLKAKLIALNEMIESSEEPLRIPQARVMNALMPAYPDDPITEWPLITRSQLAVKAGYSVISGTVTRVLNGIHKDNKTTGNPHPGMIQRGYIEVVVVDVEGVKETNYRITPSGIRAVQRFVKSGRKLPPLRDSKLCINDRYLFS